MIDISWKEPVLRIARAEGKIKLKKESIERIREKKVEKGDVFEAAKVAAFNSIKRTWEILPYCHNIPIESVKVSFKIEKDGIRVIVEVKARARTGVEMEALVGVSAALLCIWDMVKKYEKDETGNYPTTCIFDIRVGEKRKL